MYLDNASTTPVRNEVREAIIDALDCYGNPSSHHNVGYKSKEVLQSCRETIAETIGANPEEIYFTSGATEGNNWIIKGFYGTIVTSAIEHHSVLNACENKIHTIIPVIYDGIINLKTYNETIKFLEGDKFLASIMFVNNEIGTIQPIKYLANEAHNYGGFFHTDATQSYGHIPINVNKLNIDAMSMSGHKIYAPKGIGFVYIKNELSVKKLISGGQQERGMRAGTENIPYIVGLAKACELSTKEMFENNNKYIKLYNYTINKIHQIDGAFINGGNKSNIVSITIPGIRAEELAEYANLKNIYFSTGSACNSESNEPSHVLKAIGLSDEQANATIRLSFGTNNSESDIDEVVKCIEDFILIKGL